MSDRKPWMRCAIYTRKSSEEGLEQSFNSLDAQREACQAYIASQRHEGWRVIETRYDDGGYSGGTMNRPAIARLLDDIKSGKIDVVVVYKVDRLTRSLADFAKTVEIFDAHRVSFVSVTQQFNTTSSMGRLTLNVLLSFAQFEREVAGERIRDKIAASKRKGMWMGGMVPLGYDVKERKLVVNRKEADQVRAIFRGYLRLGCVTKLKKHLDKAGVKSKIRVSKAGRKSGGAAYSRGSLYELLQNRVYLGEITHRKDSYPGQHQAIVPRELWDKVQARLRSNNDARRRGVSAQSPSLLAGLIYDNHGTRFTPTHAVKAGKRYRYYVSQAAIQQHRGSKRLPSRIPAHEIEAAVSSRLRAFLTSAKEIVDTLGSDGKGAASVQNLIIAAQRSAKDLQTESTHKQREFLQAVITALVVHEASIEIKLNRRNLIQQLATGCVNGLASRIPASGNDTLSLVVDGRVKRCGGEMRLILRGEHNEPARVVPSMIKAVARAHHWRDLIVKGNSTGGRGLAKRFGFDERYISAIVRCAFLAPDIVEAILNGRQPANLTLAKLTTPLPMDWGEQRRMLGVAVDRPTTAKLL
jgi:DNA invertase Pin-like site-specific DNA recombinase